MKAIKQFLLGMMMMMVCFSCSSSSKNQPESSAASVHKYDGAYRIIYHREGLSDTEGFVVPVSITESKMKISFYTKDKEIVEISGTVDESGKLSLNAILGDVKITTQGQINDTREATGIYSFEREGKVIKGEFHGKKTGEVSQQAPVNAIGLGAILGAIFGK